MPVAFRPFSGEGCFFWPPLASPLPLTCVPGRRWVLTSCFSCRSFRCALCMGLTLVPPPYSGCSALLRVFFSRSSHGLAFCTFWCSAPGYFLLSLVCRFTTRFLPLSFSRSALRSPFALAVVSAAPSPSRAISAPSCFVVVWPARSSSALLSPTRPSIAWRFPCCCFSCRSPAPSPPSVLIGLGHVLFLGFYRI